MVRRETADPLVKSYARRVNEAVGKAWYTQMRFHASLLTPGVLKMSFVVKPDGRVARVQVISNTSNESLAAVSTTALMEAKIPPIPLNVLATTKGGGLEMDFTFSVD